MIKYIILGVVVLFVLLIVMTSYVKAPPDKAYIISGLRRRPKVLIGRAGLKLPFLERKDELIVKQISIDIKTGDYVPTSDFIGVNIDAVAKIRLMTDQVGIQKAMANFLNMNVQSIDKAFIRFFIFEEKKVVDGHYSYRQFIEFVKQKGATQFDAERLRVPEISKEEIMEFVNSGSQE